MAERPRLFAEPVPPGNGLAYTAGGLCTIAYEAGARVVHLCGERPGGDADGFAYWRDANLGAWEPRPQGHYLRDLLTPVLRYQHPDGAQVDIRAAGEWFGDHTDITPAEAQAAFAVMRDALEVRVPGAVLCDSPQATGTDLLLRTLPAGAEYEPLDGPTQEQIRATATQGRIETWPAFDGHPAASATWRAYVKRHGRPDGTIPQLVEYDGRFMYAALCFELPAGEPSYGPGWPDPGRLGYREGTAPEMIRGRYLCEWRAPEGWAHVGILPYLDSRGWSWPVSRSWSAGWIDGAEMLVALRWGWEVKVRRHVAWGPPGGHGGPLRAWAEMLVGARDHALLLGRDRVHEFAAAGLRAILLTTIGVLHGRGHTVTRTAPLEAPPASMAGRPRVEGDTYIWSEAAGPARPEFSHPEWSAAIWARCRARLLDARGPGGRTGALHLDPATIVGFSVDALYLTDDPGWADDGKVGRLRRRAVHPGPMPAPANRTDLLALLREVRA